MKLYEVRIYECAVTTGLFKRPERYRLTNMAQYGISQTGSLWLHWGEGRWEFIDNKARIYDPMGDRITTAEIVGELPMRLNMEPDRFEVIGPA